VEIILETILGGSSCINFFTHI